MSLHFAKRTRHAGLAIYCTALIGFSGYVLADAFLIPRQLDSVGITAADLGVQVQSDTSSTEAETSAESTNESTQGSSSTSQHGHHGHGSSATNSTSSSTSASTEETGSVSASSQSSAASSTNLSYVDENIQVSISTKRVNDTTVYIADVQLASAEYLQTALAGGSYGRNIKSTTSEMAEEANAILAINGDFYGWRDAGYVIRNGVLYRESSAGNQALVISADGTLSSAEEGITSARDLLASGAMQVLSFGPVLVEDGQVAVSTTAEVGQSKSSNPRTAIGMISPLHYVFVVSDGRTDESEGLSLYELAQVLQEAGCTFAYNLDGGGSSTLWFQGQVVNTPTSGRSSGEREVSDIVYIGY